MKKIRLVKWDKKNNGTSCNSCDALYVCKKSLTFTTFVANELNLNGEELEKLVKQNIPNEVIFLGIDDEKLGQKLILLIEGLESESINQKLSTINYKKSFHKPKGIIFVEQIPRTPNGKVNRLALKKLIEK